MTAFFKTATCPRTESISATQSFACTDVDVLKRDSAEHARTPEQDATPRRPSPQHALPTLRQLGVLRFIEREIENEGRPPTTTEIASAFDQRSKNGVNDYLAALELKGLIERDAKTARGIRVTAAGFAALGCRAVIGVTGTVEEPHRCARMGCPVILFGTIEFCPSHRGAQ